MELQQSTPPPPLQYHHPSELAFPSVPQTALSRPQVQAEITLPDLRTVLSPDFENIARYAPPVSPTSVRSLPRMDPGPAPFNGARSSMESAIASPSEAGSVMSIDDRRGARSTSVVSIDDPNVRMAAEALSGLGNPDRTRSHGSSTAARDDHEGPEPLLQLFTRAHPWVGGTINGSLNAYSTTKYYSPRLVQYGANLVERNVGGPVASTVSTVGRVTGIESGLRWYYGGYANGTPDLERASEDSTGARRRLDEMDLESGTRSSSSNFHRESEESTREPLPAYGSSKPPSYREEASPIRNDRQPQSWSSQVFVMTSGLSIALSDTSRSSLRYCLQLLSNSAERVSILMHALKMVLEQYDQARDAFHSTQDASIEKGERPQTPDQDQEARRLAELLKKHSDDIWQTLQTVVNNISSYAGGALPDNARQFVRNQLMSLPQRWRFVSDNQTGDSETSRSAHRMIAFATEGLDMMAQVNQTMKLTLDSAEKWLARTGRQSRGVDSPQGMDKDVEMGGVDARSRSDEKR